MLHSYNNTPSYMRQQPVVSHSTLPRVAAIVLATLGLSALLLTLVFSLTGKQVGALTGAGTAAATTGAVADWTVLVYMASDNNLEAAALDNLREIAHVGSSAHLNLVAQVDRISSRNIWDDTTAGNWTGTKRFLVQPGMEPDAAMAVQDLGELNTGDPTTLADFITWGITRYPAKHYALVLWSHGAAWQGLANDETSGGDNLTLPELGKALAAAQQQTGFTKLDLLGFDACLMAQLDVLQTIAPYAQVAVASAELEPTKGWAWDAWLSALVANPDHTATSIAEVIVKSYMSLYQRTEDVTLAAFDLTQVSAISVELDRLAGALLTGQPTDGANITQARTAVEVYASTNSEQFNAVDLGQLSTLLAARGATGEVTAAAAAMATAIKNARFAYDAGQSHINGSGLSIYFPPTAAQYLPAYEHDSPLTNWAKFLKAYHLTLIV